MWPLEKKTPRRKNMKNPSELPSEEVKLNINEDQILFTDETNILQIAQWIVNCGVQEDPFYLVDIQDIVRKYKVWCEKMPRIKPFYAVKCNDHPFVLNVLAALGTGFDCASKEEMTKIIKLGIDPSRIIFANPAKLPSHINYAKESAISLMTFDNEFELQKIKKLYPDAKLVLRIRSDAYVAQISLGNKFGCDLKTEAPALLREACNLNLNIVGICFHVGSGCGEPKAYRRSIKAASELMELGKQFGFHMKLLDIGGGFHGRKNSSLDEVAEIINSALEKYFPPGCGINVISEPGTYFVASAFTIAAEVHSKRTVDDPREPGSKYNMFWIDDGLYSSFDMALHEPESIKPIVLKMSRDNFSGPVPSTIWGPVMTNNDYIRTDVELPDMNIGDWLIFENMGAYSTVCARRMQGNSIPKFCALVDQSTRSLMENLIQSGKYPVHIFHRALRSEDGFVIVPHRNLESSMMIPALIKIINLCKRLSVWHTNRWHLM